MNIKECFVMQSDSIEKRQLIVQKFGGTSVGSLERIEKSAEIILDKWSMGCAPVVVVSAMSGETNRLETMARNISHREDAAMELVLSSGEQVTVGLMSLMLDRLARERGYIRPDESIASPYLSHQLPIGTHSNEYADAKIEYVNHAQVWSNASAGKITVLPGYQAFNGTQVLTLGRGGSDTSAVSIAGLIEADLCEIYTDVDGVYSTDPRLCEDAIKYDLITTDEMQILSKNGAKVMHHKAIDAAHTYKVPVVVKSSFEPSKQGTMIVHPELIEKYHKEDTEAESIYIYGLTMLKDVMAVELPLRSGLKKEIMDNLPLLSLTEQNERIQVILDSKYWDNLNEIVKNQKLDLDRPKSLYGKISILGENLSSDSSLIEEAIETVKDNLDGTSHSIKGVQKNNEVITFLVNREAAADVTRKIHDCCQKVIGPKLKGVEASGVLNKLSNLTLAR